MTKKVTLTLSIFSVLLFSELSAQNVYFTGVGRALVTNENLSDKTNTASKMKSSAGYTMFDLGIYGKATDVLRGGVILRTRNEFGGFFSDGAGLSFRQMQLEGLIAKKVKYDIGDIYLTHTPYTLWSNDNLNGYNKYESNLFAVRRDIVNYENFYVDNNWRMQGVNAASKINFTKGIESIGIRAYGGRTRQTNFLSIPDRYFYGGRVDLKQSKHFRIAGNIASLSDIPGTVKVSEVNYNNVVMTTDFSIAPVDNEKFRLALNGEAGTSTFKLQRITATDTLNDKFEDYFFDLGLKGTYKPLDLNIGVGFRNVGFNFNSPMAQSRRTSSFRDSTAGALMQLNNGVDYRNTNLFDYYSMEKGLYNQNISATLMTYYLPFDIVEPYGKATPNRTGFTFGADIKKPDELINANIEVNMLSEIVSEGDTVNHAKRKFTKIKGGLTFNLNKLINFEKTIALNAGIRTEGSKRGGINPIDMATSLIDLGLDVEVIKSLHLLGGAKWFNAKGYEIQSGRDEVNQIISYVGQYYNFSNNIIAAGLRYDYDKMGYFSMQYHLVESKDKIVAPGTNNYKLNQLFFVFGLKF